MIAYPTPTVDSLFPALACPDGRAGRTDVSDKTALPFLDVSHDPELSGLTEMRRDSHLATTVLSHVDATKSPEFSVGGTGAFRTSLSSTNQQSTIASAGSRRTRSARSELMTVALWRRAAITTEASTTSLVPADPHTTAAARAASSVSASTVTSVAPSSRATIAWRDPSRQICATTPAGTTSTRPSSRAVSITATVSRCQRSTAISAPESRTSVNVTLLRPAAALPPQAPVR